MAITRFRPEIWSALLMAALEKNLVYGGPGIANRNYEGEIKGQGSTVRVTSIGDIDVHDYEPGTPLTRQTLTDAQRTLVIDQQKYFNFEVDDIDSAQAKADVMPSAMKRAAYKLRDEMDRYVASLYTQAQAANVLNSGSAIAVPQANPTYFYDKVLVELSVVLDEANVPTDGRYVVIPPWLRGRGQRDDRFVNADKSGSTETLRNGFIGQASGFNIHISNNVPNLSGDDFAVTAGVEGAISFAEQINKTEAYRPEDAFSDAVKGLAVYGAKVMDPAQLAVAIVSQT